MRRPGEPHPDAIVSVEGVLDGVAALRIEEALLRAAPGDRVLVDVTAVKEFHDFGVAVVGRALARCRADVRLRGLPRQLLHVLRLYGVDSGPAERAVLPDGI